MTYYLRHKETGKDVIITDIDFSTTQVLVYDDEGDMVLTLVDWAEKYDLRYDIW